MEIKFGPSSLITIESSGYARPFDRIPVEEHTCRHPRRDVEGLVTASFLPDCFFVAFSACLFPTSLCGVLTFGAAPADRPTDRRPTTDDPRPTTDDRPTDRPTDLLLAPPLSFFYTHTRHTHVDSLTHTRQRHTRSLTVFYTHTRHTHVDSLTHTRQTHTRSLTVPFAHGARAGASLDTHTVDAHTFAHGAQARFTLDTHLGASRLVSAGRGSTSGSGRCPSAFRGPPP